MNLKEKIREIPDWPEKGVNFKDITPLLQDKDSFKFVIDELCKVDKPDIIVGIDARGFILSAVIMLTLSALEMLLS